MKKQNLNNNINKNIHINDRRKVAAATESRQTENRIDPREAKLRAVERRKTRSRSITMTIIFLVILIFTVFLILNIMKKVSPKPQFMFIQNGTIEHVTGATGLIIRDDVLMKSPADGTLKPLIEEGNRVSYGQDVAIIINKGSDESLLELENCEKQISDLQKELINKGKGPGARVIYEETDKDIAQLMNLARKESIQDSLINMDSYQTSIDVMLERRNTRLLSIDFNDSRLNALKTQKSDIERTLGLFAGTVKSKTSGIVSYHIDGLEEQIDIAKIMSLTHQQYKEFIKNSKNSLTADNAVTKNEPIIRITSGIYQYIAFYLTNTKQASFKVNSIHTVKVPLDSTTITNCKVVKSIPSNKDLFIILKTDRQLDRFSDRRTIEADISVKITEGLRIPVSSIIDFNKTAKTGKIMIVSGGYTRIAKITVIDYDREHAIIEAVKGQKYTPGLYGYLVKNPESIKEGENIGGNT
ncbi:MAG: HlyD family efflux transporter periplasmic adaptor subunit [Saccharofermentanales bacterium]